MNLLNKPFILTRSTSLRVFFLNSLWMPTGVLTQEWGEWPSRGRHYLHSNVRIALQELELYKSIGSCLAYGSTLLL